MSDDGKSAERIPCRYRCLRCGLEYGGSYVPKVMEELACPECGSNSQRRLKEEKPSRSGKG